MFKKISALLVGLLVGVSSLTMATYTSSPTYVTKTSYAFNFKATYSDGKVQTSWSKFVLPAGYQWTYMKLVASQTNSAPVYPDDGYVMYDGNMGVTSRTHTNPKVGKNYYRVCAITLKTDTQQKVRRCSNVVTVNVGTSTTSDENTNDTENEDSTSTTNTTDKYAYLYPVVDKLVTNFMAKLETKYPGDLASQKTTLQTLINNVTPLAANNSLFSYLKNKLDEQMQILNLSSLLDL